jgi:hypothetical protein
MKMTTPAWAVLAAWECARAALALAAGRQPGAAASPAMDWLLILLASQAFSAAALALLSRKRGAPTLPALAATRGVDLLALAYVAARAIAPGDLPLGDDFLPAFRGPFLALLLAASLADCAAIALALRPAGREDD